MKGNRQVFRYFTLFLLLYPLQELSAQRRFAEGYLVTRQGDTLHGYLHNTIDYELLTGVSFRKAKDDTSRQYPPSQLFAFGFSGKDREYRSFYLPYSPEGISDSAHLFLRLRIKGRAHLWEWSVDPYFKVAYVLEGPGGSTGFLPRPFSRHNQYHFFPPGFGPDSQRMAVVERLLPDCPECPGMIYGKSYKAASIRKMVAQYNRKYGRDMPHRAVPWVSATAWQFQFSMPFLKTFEKKYQAWRFGLFYHRLQPGRSLVSALHGATVTVIDDQEANRYLTMVNVLPYSLSLEGHSDRIHPYLVIGPGIAAIYDPASDEQSLSLYFPSFYFGLGNRFKLSDKSMLQVEFTPNLYGMMMTAGISF